MTQSELIEMARSHLKTFETEKEAMGAIEALTKVRFKEAAVITFGANDRNDSFEVVLDRDNGEFIGATYSPRY